MNEQFNTFLQNMLSFKQSGKNPAQLMQMIMQRNPQYNQMMTTLQNMAQGKNPREFIIQLAKQNGVGEQQLQQIMQLLN